MRYFHHAILFVLRVIRFAGYKARWSYFWLITAHHRALRPFTQFIKSICIPLSCEYLFLTKAKQQKRVRTSAGSVIFFPYASPDCLLQHELIKCILTKQNIAASVFEAERVALKAPSVSPHHAIQCENFNHVIAELVNFAQGDLNFCRGLIDEFVRSCPASVFEGDCTISGPFLDRMTALKHYAHSTVSHASAIVLADSAYGLNRALRSAATMQGKPAFALNPHGQWLQLFDGTDEHTSLLRFNTIVHKLEQNRYAYKTQADEYLKLRFSGQSLQDLDSSKAFTAPLRANSAQLMRKKVLFLHSFRDANANSFSDDAHHFFFPTYFQWADAALKLIALNQDEWYIKPHPSSAAYENEEEILTSLLTKYRINPQLLQEGLNTRHILENRWPVYTCSGTIAKETACYGYQAHTVGDQIPAAIAQRAATQAEFENAYKCPLDEAAPAIHKPVLIEAARMLVFEQFSGQVLLAKKISPSRPVLPTTTSGAYYRQRYRASLQMIGVLTRKSSLQAAEAIAAEIVCAADWPATGTV